MVSIIILAAGANTRFGSPKALVMLNHKTAVEYLLHHLVPTSVAEIIVVLGAFAEDIQPYVLNHKKVKVVYNKDFNFGQTSSVQTGLRTVTSEASGALILPVDCPLITSATVEKIIAHFKMHQPFILVPTYQHKRGHPPCFHQKMFAPLLSLNPSHRLDAFIHEQQEGVQLLEVNDPTVLYSFNTPAELEKIKKFLKFD